MFAFAIPILTSPLFPLSRQNNHILISNRRNLTRKYHNKDRNTLQNTQNNAYHNTKATDQDKFFMTLREQIQEIRERTGLKKKKQTFTLNSDYNTSDELFYDEVQRSFSHFQTAHLEAYTENKKYLDNLLGVSSCGFRRDRLNERDNLALSKKIRKVLQVLAPYARHEYVSCLVEWLLRKYAIDRHDFESLLVFALAETELISEIITKGTKARISGSEVFKQLVKEGYSLVSLAKVLGKNVSFSLGVLAVLERLARDGESLRWIVFVEKVLKCLAEREMFTEETLTLWVVGLIRLREKWLSKSESAMRNGIIMSMERSLTEIASCTELHSEYQRVISSFTSKENQSESNQVESDSNNVSPIKSTTPSFDVLYKDYKRTGKYQVVLDHYRVEFIKQLLADIKADGLTGINRDTFRTILVDSIREDTMNILPLVAASDELLLVLVESPKWNMLTKSIPELGALRLLNYRSPEVLTKRYMTLLQGLMPNYALERRLLDMACSHLDMKGALSETISMVSPKLLQDKIQNVTDWNAMSLLITAESLPHIVDLLCMGTIVSEFDKYLSLIYTFPTYTKIGHYLTPEQCGVAREKALDFFVEPTKKTPIQYFFFVLALIADLDMDITHVISILKLVPITLKRERKQVLKVVFEFLLQKGAALNGEDLLAAIEAIPAQEMDLTLSLYFFQILLDKEISNFNKEIILSIITFKETTVKKMTNYLIEHKVDLLKQVFVKYAGTIKSDDLLLLLNHSRMDIVSLLVISRIDTLSLATKQRIVYEAIKRKEENCPELFNALVDKIPLLLWQECTVDAPVPHLAAVLDLIVQHPKSKFSVPLALSALIKCRRAMLPEEQLKLWQGPILAQTETFILLAQNIIQKKDFSISKTLITRTLDSCTDSTDLLLGVINSGITDHFILGELLKHQPNGRSRALLIRTLLTNHPEQHLHLFLGLLQDMKSVAIRSTVQVKLPYLVNVLLSLPDSEANVVSHLFANLIRRETNILSPYLNKIISLIKLTKKRTLLQPLSLLDIPPFISHLANTPQDITILSESLKLRLTDQELEEADIQQVLAYYLKNLELAPTATALVSLFPQLSTPSHTWLSILKKTNGLSDLFITLLDRMLKQDQNGQCVRSLDLIYTKLESLLLSELHQPTTLLPKLTRILAKYYSYEQGTMVRTTDITTIILTQLSSTQSLQAQLTKLLACLFSSRAQNLPSEAEEINLILLKQLVSAPSKSGLFKALAAIYRRNSEFMSRILGQSAPYFAILLESPKPSTRVRAESLMKLIERTTGTTPYNYL
ncbi:hypothetical protein NEHOM01_1155 [Nematocida homosporus]|uniref:uncharacterized protein n=1 Tax=Nematocida homosporus TaxID=1912981 RepID=UPI00221EEA1C|nr:uncharacterized protein NEHOM01_1155 [Nematocida homosporus]KAI5185905.1 hypothetical protein NEHOM01_1155 [Nematocida homosporus]